MNLTSTSFSPGGELGQRYGKRSENVSPQLAWQGAPEGTRSFTLSVVDTHPVARGYVHWLLVDIPADVLELREGAAAGRLPAGVRELTPYAGPFPPSGTHEYVFTLSAVALDRAPVGRHATADQVRAALTGHVLATATLACTFTRRP